ncbi:acyl-CoA dehydrogenase family protein [Helicobacter sp. 23-1048]
MLELSNVQSKAQQIAQEVVAPITQSVDKEGRFPKEAYNTLKKEGFMGLLVPKEFGGVGGSIIEHTQVCYELAQKDATTGLCYMMHNTASACLVGFANDSMKKEFLPKIAKGEIALALAYSESGSGTHFNAPDITEKIDGNNRILTGRKSFVTSALNADYYLTNTNSCKVQGAQNNWLVDRTLPNIIHEESAWDGLGMRGNSSMPVKYNGVQVNESFLIGEEGKFEEQAPLELAYFVSGLAAVYTGLASAAYQCVLDYTKSRKYTSGQALSDIEMVKVHLAEIYTKVQSSLALVYEAARSFKAGEADCAAKIFASRINATNNVMEVCSLAMRLGGGNAYAKRLPLERYMRDCLASQVMAPSLDVLKIWLGDALVK